MLALGRLTRLDRLAPAAQRASTPPASVTELLKPIPRELGTGPVAKVLAGCVMDVAFRPTQRATMRVVAEAGFRAVRTRPAGCCGALAMHYGQPEAAKAMARERIAEMEGAEMVVVNASGCSAHVKTYGELLADDPEWAERAERVASRTRDLIELSPPPRDAGIGTVAVHDACHHLHAQRIEPRAMLRDAGRDLRGAGGRGALLRGGRPLQRAPARAGRPPSPPEGRGRRGDRRARGGRRQPGLRHPDRGRAARDRRRRARGPPRRAGLPGAPGVRLVRAVALAACLASAAGAGAGVAQGAVVGRGTPASCTSAAVVAAVARGRRHHVRLRARAR